MKNRSAYLVLLSSLFFATGGLFFKIITWDALAINAARSVIAGLMILVYLLIRRHKFRINLHVILAAVSISATNILYSLANKLTTAGNTIVLQFTMPVFVILIMLFVYHKKPKKLEIITCLLVLGGIICFFVDSVSSGHMLGDSLALLSGLLYAGFFVFNSQEDSEPFTAVLIAYTISALVGLPSLLQTDIAGSSSGVLMAVLALGFLQQGGGQICFALGIKKTPPVSASLISGLEPVLNPVLVAVFYHEILTPLSLVGAAVVLCSILFYQVWPELKKNKQKTL